MAVRKSMAKLAAADADDTRYLFSGLVVCDSAGVPRAGVTSPVNSNIVTATATMNVSVARFQGVAVRDAGALLVANDGPTNVLIGAAPASNSRIDVVYVKQNDASSTVTTPDANNTPVFGVLVGVASATPVRNPAGLPAGALELATIQVPSTAVATNSAGVVITQTAQFTASAGGVVPFRTLAALQAWTNPNPLQRASVLADSANNGEYAWGGSAWQSAVTAKFVCRLLKSIAQSTSGVAATYNLVPFDLESIDPYNAHNPGVNPSRVIVPSTGYYRVVAKAGFNPTAPAAVLIAVNGVPRDETTLWAAAAAGAFTDVSTTAMLPLTAGDYLEMWVASTAVGLPLVPSHCSFDVELVRFS